VIPVTHEHDRRHIKPTDAPPLAELDAGLADPSPAGLDALAPTVLRLPGSGPIGVTGLSVGDVTRMIRDACGVPDPADPAAPTVEAGPTREHIEEERAQVPSEPLSPDDVVFWDETTPGDWIIIGFGDETGDGFIVEGTAKPSDRTRRRGRRTATGKEPTEQKPGP
jgi:hypothetical protein